MAAPCKWSRPRETRLRGSWECFPPDIHHIARTDQVVSEFLWVTLKSEQESNLIIQLTESAVIVVCVVESIYKIPARLTFLLFVLSSTFYYFSIILKTFRSHIVIPLAVKFAHEQVITPIQHSPTVGALTIVIIYYILNCARWYISEISDKIPSCNCCDKIFRCSPHSPCWLLPDRQNRSSDTSEKWASLAWLSSNQNCSMMHYFEASTAEELALSTAEFSLQLTITIVTFETFLKKINFER